MSFISVSLVFSKERVSICQSFAQHYQARQVMLVELLIAKGARVKIETHPPSLSKTACRSRIRAQHRAIATRVDRFQRFKYAARFKRRAILIANTSPYFDLLRSAAMNCFKLPRFAARSLAVQRANAENATTAAQATVLFLGG